MHTKQFLISISDESPDILFALDFKQKNINTDKGKNFLFFLYLLLMLPINYQIPIYNYHMKSIQYAKCMLIYINYNYGEMYKTT